MTQSYLQQIHFFRMPVVDLENSVQWYTDCLGFSLKHQEENDLAVLGLDAGPLLTLVKADENSRGHFAKDGEMEYSVAFTCPEIRKFHQHLVEQGVKADEIKEDGGHFYFHFFDPSGNKMQVHW